MSAVVRNGWAVMAITALAAASAKAIDINSTTADWAAAGLYRTDVLPAAPGGIADMIGWGATVQNGRIYTIMKSATPMNSSNMWWAGAWLNADLNTTTEMSGLRPDTCMFKGVYRGSDLYWEYSPTPYSQSGTDQDGHNYWGMNHVNNPANMPASTAPVIGGETAVRTEIDNIGGVNYERGVVVQSVLLADLKAKLATANGTIPSGYEWPGDVPPGTTTLGATDGRIGVGVRLSRHMWPDTAWNDGNGNIGGSILGDPPVEVPFMVTLQAIDGDADWSGTCNVADLTKLLNNYNQHGKIWADGDFNGDGTVNVADLTKLLNNYNKSYGGIVGAGLNTGVSVPEPTSIVMLITMALSAGVWFVRHRRR